MACSGSRLAVVARETLMQRAARNWIVASVALSLLASSVPACGDGSGSNEGTGAAAGSGSAEPRGGTRSGTAGAAGNSGGPGVNYYDPDAGIDFGRIDPSIDPGPDPIFANDPELSQDETYTYVFTEPGDHVFPPDTCVVAFDAAGSQSLLQALTPRKQELAACTGFALYLTATASSLRDGDLRTLQILDRPEAEGGLAATRLARLYVYNLKSMSGGIECTPESGAVWPNSGALCANTRVRGDHTWLWANGWAEGWVRDLVMDDLIEAPDGAFCSAKFYTLSMRGLQKVGKMAFGEQPHGHLRVLYLPSVTSIGEHAFRRIQVGPSVLTKVVLPKVKDIGSYAFDDNTDLGYVNAPELETIGRNVFNDTGKLISVNMPKLRSMVHACFGVNDSMRVLRLPGLETLNGDGLNTLRQLRFFYAPSLTRLAGGALGNNGLLEAAYLPKASVLDGNALGGATSLKKLSLPAPAVTLNTGSLQNTGLEELSVRGRSKTLRGTPFTGSSELRVIYFGATVPVQEADAFTGTNAGLVGYYTGDDPAWTTFTFRGNPTAMLVRE
jgi:hypothetical protein